jgi:glutathione synthase
MKLLFVADPLSTFNIQKDSTFTMMREAQVRGHELWCCDTKDLHWQTGQPVSAQMHQVHLTGDPAAWFTIQQTCVQPLHSMGAVVMRKDPPFDNEYFYATHLLSQAEKEGAQCFQPTGRIARTPRKTRPHGIRRVRQPDLGDAPSPSHS